jgi:hypothetical protein
LGDKGERVPRDVVTPPEHGYVDWGPALPAQYDIDRLVGMVRDPFRIFFYWELFGSKRAEFIAARGASVFDGAMLLMRVTHAESAAVVDVFPVTNPGNWYFHAQPLSTYYASIGYLTPDEEFLVFAESEPVRTPAAGPGGRGALTTEQRALHAEMLRQVLSVGSSRLGITSPTRFASSSLWGVEQ